MTVSHAKQKTSRPFAHSHRKALAFACCGLPSSEAYNNQVDVDAEAQASSIASRTASLSPRSTRAPIALEFHVKVGRLGGRW